MKLRIGIYLSCLRHDGGTHQYAQSLLEALALLPVSEYETVALCTTPEWQSLAARFGVQSQLTRVVYAEKALSTIWLRGHLPASLWQQTVAHCQTAYHAARALGCTLWLFPAHDRWSYLWPLPSIPSVHDLMHRYESRFPEVGHVRHLRDLHFRSIARHCGALFVDSDCGREQFCESYGVEPKKVVPLPYVPPPHIRHAGADEPGRLPEGLPAKYFFYPAQFWPHKNHARLFAALARVSAMHPDVQLVLSGAKSREYQSLRTLADSLRISQRLHFLGYVDDADMRELYRRARALVMPTFFGPTNIPPLEAFALGCPVAISRRYGMPEQVGDAALLFDPESTEEMTEVMQRLWGDDALCESLKQRGFERAQHWDVPALSQRLQALLPVLALQAAR
ncbi:MAG: glycosyltransferase family 1 protein [Pseudomonadota bacterium]